MTLLLSFGLVNMQNQDPIEDEIRQIGERIKKLRIDAGYTSYVDFAIQNDMQPKQYWRLEAGVANFTIRTLLKIIKIHGISLEEFFKGFK